MKGELDDKINFPSSVMVSKWIGDKITYSCNVENGDVSEAEMVMLSQGNPIVALERIPGKREYQLVLSQGHTDERTGKFVFTHAYKLKRDINEN